MIIRYTILFSLLVNFTLYSFDDVPFVPDEYIIKYKPYESQSKEATIRDARFVLASAGFLLNDVIFPEHGIYLVQSHSRMSPIKSMSLLSMNPEIEYIQKNHILSLRNIDNDTDKKGSLSPNDPDFLSQWNFHNDTSGISATNAWYLQSLLDPDTTTKPVVAVIDGGFDVNHNDLKDNIWTNVHEIPDNGIDDDNNGYIDDIHGWNAYKNSGEHNKGQHGTHVAGIIGASGNNNLLVSGLNWDIGIMPISGSSRTTATIVKAYTYALNAKKRFIETDGVEGANVVSTNSSFGIDFADCQSKDYPVWNDMYTELGKWGILSAAAGPNRNIDVDEKGDVPTGCDSPFIISVTNTTESNKKYSSAPYGKVSIDLGAPGTAIVSTVPGDGTQKMTGTSMATPHIAGAVGFLHQIANNKFNTYYQTQPAAAALTLKELLISSVDIMPDLDGKTISGGRLNLFKSATALTEFQDDTRVAP